MSEYRCEGIGSVNGGSYDKLYVEGVTNVKGSMEAGNCNMEGVLNASSINIAGTFYADGVVNTDTLKAGSATLLFNSKKCNPRPFAKVRAFFSGRDVQDEKNAKIREIEADTLIIEDYSVKKITGQDITIGRGCIVDAVQARTRLRIHKTAAVKNMGSSVAPEYFE